METPSSTHHHSTALEIAAKYICTIKCGLCPMAVEDFPCPQACTMDVRPWQCWVAYFTQKPPKPPLPS